MTKSASTILASASRSAPDAVRPSSPADEGGAAVRVSKWVAMGKVDGKSLVYATGAGAGFFLLATLCLALSRFDAALASLWLPNAAAVAVLLLARLRNEIPMLIAIGVGSIAANFASGNSLYLSLIFTSANLTEIVLVPLLVRRTCGGLPDMTDLADLGRFLQYGGVVGPLVSASIAAIALAPGTQSPLTEMFAWFLADSMGMILIVPALLLIADAVRSGALQNREGLVARAGLILGGLCAIALVTGQGSYPLLFLAPPVTLLMAFRLGGLGTALFVPALAGVSAYMTYLGYGPIVQNHTSDISKIFVLQTFVAANFLTGLPIVAILAGRERLTEQMRSSQAELSLLADNVTDAVIKLDNDGVVTYVSPSVREVLDRDPEEMIGSSVIRRTHEDATDRIVATLDRLRNGECEKERVTYRRLLDAEDGTPVFIEADCATAHDPSTGERLGFIVSARDVTDRVELELLLTRARRTAENAARAKSEFLANMSHEIRTPMNGVLGFAELILQDDLDEEHRRHTEMIVQSGRSMMLLLNDILDLSKIEAGQIAIDEAPVDLHATLEECAALHRVSAERKGLELEFACIGGNDGAWLITDALRVRQIVLNLVGNAVKFTDNGRVAVHYRADEEQVTVMVSDSGIGISPSRIDTIFAPFTQGESDTARRFGGTGLGLTISRQLAELLGGWIDVESELGEGATFTLTLPANYTEPKEPAHAETQAIKPADLPQAASVLLVEDHDVNRLLGTEMLERCGQSVAIAHDGNEAIAMVIDSVMRGRPFDLVLMDIQMPGCDGYAATRAIRAEGIGPETMPIVALTANAFPEDIAAAKEAGMQAHLAKPLVFADLARALQRWLPVRIVEAKHEAGEDDSPALNGEVQPPPPHRSARQEPVSAQYSGSDAHMNDGARASPRPAPSETSQGRQSATHSPALLARWTERRTEAIEAVRTALEDGALGSRAGDAGDELAGLVHKLAGTAAMFGEAELGDQAAAFERALRMKLAPEVQEALAFELLSAADNPTDRRSASGG